MVGTSIRVKNSTKDKLIKCFDDKTLSQEQMILQLIEENKRLKNEVADLKKILTNIEELMKLF